MKFSHSLQLNATPEWKDHYIAYSHLKKLIYSIEKDILGLPQTFLPPGTGREGEEGAGPSEGNLRESKASKQASSGSLAGLPSGKEVPSNLAASLESLSRLEAQPLIGSTGLTPMSQDQANVIFSAALDEEMEKVSIFYIAQEAELFKQVADIFHRIQQVEHGFLITEGGGVTAGGAASSLEQPSTLAHSPSIHRHSLLLGNSDHMLIPGNRTSGHFDQHHRTSSSYHHASAWNSLRLKKQRDYYLESLVQLYVTASELESFVALNYQGCSKVLKKFDKVVGSSLKLRYMSGKVDTFPPFQPTAKERLRHCLKEIVSVFSRIGMDGNLELGEAELKSHLRQHIVWERNTIWRDMIEKERKFESVTVEQAANIPFINFREVKLFGQTFNLPVASGKFVALCVISLVFIFLINFPIFKSVEQSHCLAILLFASVLWALELIPLFVTGILIPFLIVTLRVMREPVVDAELHDLDADALSSVSNSSLHPSAPISPTVFERCSAKEAAKKIFSSMFGPVIMLLLGGFTLAAALSKHNIAKRFASFVLAKSGSSPKYVILANMFVSTFSSMWISNVAAPVLCFSLIAPILRNQPSASPYAKALILGIALAANVGGMASPISSPQNIVAMGTMDPAPSWGSWFLISIPACIVIDLLIWGILLFQHRPDSLKVSPPELLHSSEAPLTGGQWYIIAVSAITIVLWCFQHSLEPFVGDMGVIAILPILAFYGVGILTKDDWNSMPWTVVILAMGGISLGKAVESSGLLSSLTSTLIPFLSNLRTWECMALISTIVLITTNFISHTVGALIILPIVAQIGGNLPDPRPRTMVMVCTLMCSAGMGLPVSSFPNMNALGLEDPTGKPWLTSLDFIKSGVVSSVAAFVCLLLIAYPLMNLVQFH